MVNKRRKTGCSPNHSKSETIYIYIVRCLWYHLTRVSHTATQPQLETINKRKQLTISMSHFADLLCNCSACGAMCWEMAADKPVLFSTPHTWSLIMLGLFALFLFPEKKKPEGSGPTALQHVHAGLQHRYKCHTMLAHSLQGRLRWEDHKDNL